MKFKIKKTLLMITVYIIAILLSMRFFYLDIINISYQMLTPISIIGFVLCMLLCKNTMNFMRRKMKYVFIYGFVFLFCYCIIFLSTLIVFPKQGFRTTLGESGYFIAILLIYPLEYYLLKKNDESVVFRILNIFTLFWYILVIIQKILYDTSGDVILSGLLVDGEFYIRNDNLRITLQPLGNIMLVYNFYILYTQLRNINFFQKILTIFMTIIGTYEVVFIQQTRAYTIIVFVCFFLIILFDRNTSSGFVKKILLITITAFLIYQTGIATNMIDSFSVGGKYGHSTKIRMYSYEYYWNYFLDHPLLGMGFANDTFYYDIVHSPLGIAFHSDVGIVGQLSRWGLLIVPVYIIPLIRWSFIALELYKNKFEDYILYISLLTYIFGTSFTLIMLINRLIILFPTLIILFEFKYYKLKNMKVTS